MKKRLMNRVVLLLLICGLFPATSLAAQFRVLVVMSYSEEYPWVAQIREGIDSVLDDICEIRCFHMNTKKNVEEGPAKAKEAYKLYQEFRPDGVITADDNAQSMFVVPYLKDKVRTPVMFCGVNAKPEKYAYPASNVSGVLERPNFAESLAFIKQFRPSVKTFGYLFRNNATGKAFAEQIEDESHGYVAKLSDTRLVNTLKEAKDAARELRLTCDALCMAALHGMPDENGTPLNQKKVIPILANTYGKLIFGGTVDDVRYGMLCAVSSTGVEQGRIASQMLLKAMKGTPVSQIPVTRDQHGNPIINVEVMKDLGIPPTGSILQGAELLKTEK